MESFTDVYVNTSAIIPTIVGILLVVLVVVIFKKRKSSKE